MSDPIFTYVEFHYEKDNVTVTFSAQIMWIAPYKVSVWYDGNHTDPVFTSPFDGMITPMAAMHFARIGLTLVKG